MSTIERALRDSIKVLDAGLRKSFEFSVFDAKRSALLGNGFTLVIRNGCPLLM